MEKPAASSAALSGTAVSRSSMVIRICEAMGGKKTAGTGKGEGCYIVAVALDLREQLQHSLGEAYRIERELGGGGMSRVFLALETSLHRRVVVKVLLPELAAGVSVERFRREIHLAAQLQHPHIVPLLSAGESLGLPYFTMPYVDGESLRARLLARARAAGAARRAGAPRRGGRARVCPRPGRGAPRHQAGQRAALPRRRRRHRLRRGQGADGLHRPGRCRPQSRSHLARHHARHARYMAPEQGAADPAMDHRADLYAFGIMAYEMLAGEPPFTGPSPQAVLGAHIAGIPRIGARRPGTPPLLAHLIMKCLEKRPADRPQSADEIIGALDMLSTPSGTVPVTTMRSVRASRRAVACAPRRRTPLRPGGGGRGARGCRGALVWPRRATTPPTPPPPAAAAPDPPPDSPRWKPPSPTGADSPVGRAGGPEASGAGARPGPAVPTRHSSRHRPGIQWCSPGSGRRRRAPAPARWRRAADDSIIARGDSSMARAESLAGIGRSAEAAAELSTSTALWSAAAARPAGAVPRRPCHRARRARSRATATASAADPTQEIHALFAEYGAAIEARSLVAIRSTYPGLLPSQAREWEEFFQSVTDIDVELAVSDLKVAGNAAEARLEGVYVFRNPSTRRTQHEPVGFLATLRREGTRWRIASLR